MTSLENLLETRERRALRFVLGFRMFFVASGFVAAFFTTASHGEFIGTIAALSLIFTLCVVSFFFLRNRRMLFVAGLGGALADLAILALLPFLWYDSVGGSQISRAYVLKLANLTSMSFVMLVLNSIASRPLYPAVITAGVTLIHTALFAYAAQDPGIEFTDDYVRHMLGPAVKPDIFVTSLLSFVFAGVSLTFFTYLARKTVYQAAHLEKTQAQVSRYFSPAVYRTIRDAEEDFFNRSGKLQQATVLFSDFRGFTALSESMEPSEVIELLREYHETMVSILFRHGGTLDKFVGDAIMAVFGTPEPGPDDPDRALLCALEMKEALVQLNSSRVSRGLPALRQGIGVHCGPVVAGNIGTHDRLEYTVIGDTVNTASRLESATREIGAEIIVSETVLQAASPALAGRFQAAGKILIRGKENPVSIYAA